MKIWVIPCMCILFLTFNKAQSQDEQSVRILREIDQSPQAKKDSLYYELVKIFRSSNPELSKYYSLLGLRLAEKHKHQLLSVRFCNALGFLFNQQRNFDSSIFYYRYGVQLATPTLPKRLIYLYNDLGSVYETADVYDSALANYLRSFEIAQEQKEYQDQAIANNNIGTIYSRLENFHEAATYYRNAITIKRDNDILDGLDLNLLNLAFCLNATGEHEEALKTIQDVIEFCKSNPCDRTKEPDIYYSLGHGYLFQGEHTKAYEAFKYSHEKASELEDKQNQAASLVMMGVCEIKSNDLSLAQSHLVEAQEIAYKGKFKRLLRDAYEQLSIVYEKEGLLTKSLEMKNKFISIKDSIFNEQLANNLRELQVDATRKQSQRIIDEKDSALNRNRLITGLTGAVSLLTIGLSISLFINLRNNRNMKIRLQKEVDTKTITLTQTNESLANVNFKLQLSQKEYDSLIYRTSHDIRGPLATLKGLSTLALRDHIKEPEAIGGYLEKIELTTDKLNAVLSGLILVSQIRTQSFTREPVLLLDLLHEAIKQSSKLENFPLVEVQIDVEDNFSVKTDPYLLTLALGKIIHNSFFYSNPQAKSYIRIHASHSDVDEMLHIKIEDNGMGIPLEVREIIFDLFSVGSEKHGAGIGLYAARQAVEKLNGSILLTRIKNPTVFEIRIPV